MRGAVDNFKRLVRWAMSDVIHYWRMYPCEVVGQAADGSLDLMPDDESIRGNGLQGVPLKVGLPGFRVKVPNGSRIMLGYENGDPKRPYAVAWEPGSVTEITFDGGTQAVARKGDTVRVGGTGTLVTLVPVSGSGAPPNNAIVAGVPCLISFDKSPPTALYAAPLDGEVISGNDKFKA